EIIIADDCSPDGTYKIVQQLAAGYGGPHRLRLVQNSMNLGIRGNINRAMEICAGEFVVAAAGDDVSLPERVDAIHRVWEESGRKATSIFSSYITISGKGVEKGVGGLRGHCNTNEHSWRLEGDLFTFLAKRQPIVNGCTGAWSRD